MKNSVITGLQLTGKLHIGNYFGSIKPLIDLQSNNDTMIFVADLHAMTSNPLSNLNNKDYLNNVAMYIACGIDEKFTSIFLQSKIPYLFELFWTLNCFSKHGDLSRMTQFKSNSKKNNSFALMSYPVLMAADILLYGAKIVPVGNDQLQHLEITRKIASHLNKTCGQDILTLPTPLESSSKIRIMNLRDGRIKMSKSELSDATKINLNDTNDEIAKKIRSAKTDSENNLSHNINNRPEILNLVNIFSLVSGASRDRIIEDFNNTGFKNFKESLAEAVIGLIEPIRKNYKNLIDNKSEIASIIERGRLNVIEKAEKTINLVRFATGIKN